MIIANHLIMYEYYRVELAASYYLTLGYYQIIVQLFAVYF